MWSQHNPVTHRVPFWAYRVFKITPHYSVATYIGYSEFKTTCSSQTSTKTARKYSTWVNVLRLLSTPRGRGWMLFSGWKQLLQPWSYWHPFHLIRTLGLRVDKTLREIILLGECGGDKLASGSVWESPLWQAEEKGLAGSRGRPRQGRLGGPMLRPPPCLWQTRQWIISSSGTRPSAVGLRGKGAVIQAQCRGTAFVCVCSMHHKHTLVCIVYFHCAQLMHISISLCTLFLSSLLT